jgi:hypothetical protein
MEVHQTPVRVVMGDSAEAVVVPCRRPRDRISQSLVRAALVAAVERVLLLMAFPVHRVQVVMVLLFWLGLRGTKNEIRMD